MRLPCTGAIGRPGGVPGFRAATQPPAGGADAPGAGPFTVTLVDDSEAFGGTALLQFTQPTGTYMPGDKLHVPVKVLGLDPGLDGGEAFEVDTTPVSGGGPATAYYGLVVQ